MGDDMDNRLYGLSEAADVADVPLDELRRAVHDGLVAAVQKNGELRIPAEELARYVRRSRHADPFGHQKKRKVLILGEDLLFAGTLKLELARDPRMDVRYASWGRDALLMVDHYGANLFVVDLTPSQAIPEEVLTAINVSRASAESVAVAYYAVPDEQLDAHPIVQARLASLGAVGAVSKTKGLRALTIECFKALGLDTNTKIFRLHG
jgi:hypothetical protein